MDEGPSRKPPRRIVRMLKIRGDDARRRAGGDSSVTVGLDEVTLFLGAGVSLAEPAGGPLFGEIRDACARRVGIDPARWRSEDPRHLLLEHVIPEVFLKEFADAGFELHAALADAVRGTPGIGPNTLHVAAAKVIAAGGVVWTTNWDEWIEEALGASTDLASIRAVAGQDHPAAQHQLFKVHGTISRPASLMFATPQIMQPLDEAWLDRLVACSRGRLLVVAGYSGADLDLYPGLRQAVHEARATYWLEGVGEARPSQTPAPYVSWRFALQSSVLAGQDLPDSGAHLVWCGGSAAWRDPSHALLEILGAPASLDLRMPSREMREAAVDAHIQSAPRGRGHRDRQLLMTARVAERLGCRWRAATRHLVVLGVGGQAERRAVRERSGQPHPAAKSASAPHAHGPVHPPDAQPRASRVRRQSLRTGAPRSCSSGCPG